MSFTEVSRWYYKNANEKEWYYSVCQTKQTILVVAHYPWGSTEKDSDIRIWEEDDLETAFRVAKLMAGYSED